MRFSPWLAAFALGTAALSARADGFQAWMNPGLLAYHFDRTKDYRERNWGIGVEAQFGPDHGAVLGNYINSENSRSQYVGYEWRPLHWQPGGAAVSAGVAAILIDGYASVNDGNWFLAPVPMLSVEGTRFGANFVFIPNVKHGSAVAVQLKLRVW